MLRANVVVSHNDSGPNPPPPPLRVIDFLPELLSPVIPYPTSTPFQIPSTPHTIQVHPDTQDGNFHCVYLSGNISSMGLLISV